MWRGCWRNARAGRWLGQGSSEEYEGFEWRTVSGWFLADLRAPITLRRWPEPLGLWTAWSMYLLLDSEVGLAVGATEGAYPGMKAAGTGTISICIVGTSNSVMKEGWTAGLLSSIDCKIDKYCLGGAPFVQFVHHLAAFSNLKYDCFIVECSPTDEAYAAVVGSEDLFYELYFKFLSTLRSLAPVFIFRIPAENHLNSTSKVFERQREIAVELQCCIVDVADFIKSISNPN